MQRYEGFFNFYWDEKEGKIWLEVDRFDTEFLYVESLQAGVGSNDIGLDRGQLGMERVVKFSRIGDKVLLTHLNYGYRASSDNPEERRAVEEAFAQSVLWGFKVEAEEHGKVLADATLFLLRDAHNIVLTLKNKKQGTYKLDESRSAIYLPRTKNFPKNTEFEATLTYAGTPEGDWIRTVTPTPELVTVRQHHSFIALPDGDFEPRPFDPRSGYSEMRYYDYSTPIDQPVVKRFITRHRLKKQDPSAAVSAPVAPIVYYLDPGTPEPIRSALLEGAGWWNQAFEAAGYRDAFQVKMLPPDADPMDVRYNLIQWVHRSTRGWSYGGGVTDPRTGEIIKGKVTLGSLRVRQDFLIAQGLLAAYEKGDTADPRLLEMALARLRQLSAHEVGHTLGLAHNFAASTNDRASVMDYPHPYIALDENGNPDFSKAYDDKIGEWDKRSILYGYQDFRKGTNVAQALDDILKENHRMGLRYLSDQDARPENGAAPLAHLWDNGTSATDELRRLAKLRETALKHFSLHNIPNKTPLAELERILVPLYLAHRYQVEAVSKLIGGVHYTYTVKGFETSLNEDWKVTPVDDRTQQDALQAMLETINPRFLEIPASIRALIPPPPIGFNRDRETFNRHGTRIRSLCCRGKRCGQYPPLPAEPPAARPADRTKSSRPRAKDVGSVRLRAITAASLYHTPGDGLPGGDCLDGGKTVPQAPHRPCRRQVRQPAGHSARPVRTGPTGAEPGAGTGIGTSGQPAGAPRLSAGRNQPVPATPQRLSAPEVTGNTRRRADRLRGVLMDKFCGNSPA